MVVNWKNDNNVHIRHEGMKSAVMFTPSRWSSFHQSFDKIDQQLYKRERGEHVNYRKHIGAGWYVSVSTKFPCVDIRKFDISGEETDCKTIMDGIAIRLSEWTTLKQAVKRLHEDHPIANTFTPCSNNPDHNTPEGIASCMECNISPIMSITPM